MLLLWLVQHTQLFCNWYGRPETVWGPSHISIYHNETRDEKSVHFSWITKINLFKKINLYCALLKWTLMCSDTNQSQNVLTVLNFVGTKKRLESKIDEVITLALSHHLISYNPALPEYKSLHRKKKVSWLAVCCGTEVWLVTENASGAASSVCQASCTSYSATTHEWISLWDFLIWPGCHFAAKLNYFFWLELSLLIDERAEGTH